MVPAPITTASAHARSRAMRKRSAGCFALITEPADVREPRETTPSSDDTKFEYTTRSGNPSRPYRLLNSSGNVYEGRSASKRTSNGESTAVSGSLASWQPEGTRREAEDRTRR